MSRRWERRRPMSSGPSPMSCPSSRTRRAPVGAGRADGKKGGPLMLSRPSGSGVLAAGRMCAGHRRHRQRRRVGVIFMDVYNAAPDMALAIAIEEIEPQTETAPDGQRSKKGRLGKEGVSK